MQKLTGLIMQSRYAKRPFTEQQLAHLLNGSAQRRYGLVNRALKAGELIRLQRGLYVLDESFRQQPLNPFYLAQVLAPGSYISLETALSYHGWIPEAVYITASIVRSAKSRTFEHPQFGRFTFQPLAIHKPYYLELVERVQWQGQTLLLAKPVRALMDLVCCRKATWQNLDWITQGLRIEMESLSRITADDLSRLQRVYKHRRVQVFLAELERALGLKQGRNSRAEQEQCSEGDAP